VHVSEELTDTRMIPEKWVSVFGKDHAPKTVIGMRQYQEPLMVKFVEYLSDGCEEGFLWLH
jgi:hypothetical protein